MVSTPFDIPLDVFKILYTVPEIHYPNNLCNYLNVWRKLPEVNLKMCGKVHGFEQLF